MKSTTHSQIYNGIEDVLCDLEVILQENPHLTEVDALKAAIALAKSNL